MGDVAGDAASEWPLFPFVPVSLVLGLTGMLLVVPTLGLSTILVTAGAAEAVAGVCFAPRQASSWMALGVNAGFLALLYAIAFA